MPPLDAWLLIASYLPSHDIFNTISQLTSQFYALLGTCQQNDASTDQLIGFWHGIWKRDWGATDDRYIRHFLHHQWESAQSREGAPIVCISTRFSKESDPMPRKAFPAPPSNDPPLRQKIWLRYKLQEWNYFLTASHNIHLENFSPSHSDVPSPQLNLLETAQSLCNQDSATRHADGKTSLHCDSKSVDSSEDASVPSQQGSLNLFRDTDTFQPDFPERMEEQLKVWAFRYILSLVHKSLLHTTKLLQRDGQDGMPAASPEEKNAARARADAFAKDVVSWIGKGSILYKHIHSQSEEVELGDGLSESVCVALYPLNRVDDPLEFICNYSIDDEVNETIDISLHSLKGRLGGPETSLLTLDSDPAESNSDEAENLTFTLKLLVEYLFEYDFSQLSEREVVILAEFFAVILNAECMFLKSIRTKLLQSVQVKHENHMVM